MKTLEVKLTFDEDILGTAPADKEIYRNYIGTKAPDPDTANEEAEALDVEAAAEKTMTVFARDEEGRPCLYDYHVKGHFKDACSMLKKVPKSKSSGLKAHKKEIDGLIFVSPSLIPLEMPEGKTIGNCQRPLRASTAMGERVALAMSESVPAGSTCTFEVTCLVDSDIELVREWLDYGKLRGIGQWRNSGCGRYSYEELRCY